MPRRLLRATPTRLATFEACPRRYRMTYLDRPPPQKGPPWAHSSLGSAVHLALRRWWDLSFQRRTAESAASLLGAAWLTDGFADRTQSDSWRERAADWLRRYVATLDPGSEPVGVERTVAARTRGLALSGRVDRIDERDGELVVVDYKTGRRSLDAAAARSSPALALYLLAVRSTMRRPSRRVELHHLPTGEVLTAEHDAESLRRHLDRAENIAEDIVTATDTLGAGALTDEVFPPVPGPMCGWCDFRRHCPEGQAAAAERAPSDGLAELD